MLQAINWCYCSEGGKEGSKGLRTTKKVDVGRRQLCSTSRNCIIRKKAGNKLHNIGCLKKQGRRSTYCCIDLDMQSSLIALSFQVLKTCIGRSNNQPPLTLCNLGYVTLGSSHNLLIALYPRFDCVPTLGRLFGYANARHEGYIYFGLCEARM